jgi:hypothetical protein
MAPNPNGASAFPDGDDLLGGAVRFLGCCDGRLESV